jgi:formamidopyrimidine-DNA glycosylase
MPELPEVHTTATILNTLVRDKKILDVWSDYDSPFYRGKENIKDPSYFRRFRKEIVGKKIIQVWRRAKNVLVDIEGNKTILIHMKMTGHLLHGTFELDKTKREWKALKDGPLKDPFNRFIHFVITLSDGNHVAFSDMRKFATIHLISDKEELTKKFRKLGPEPLEKSFDWKMMKERLLKRPKYKIKTALMDQRLVAGIGNIYSDEILWMCKVHPEKLVDSISDSEFKVMTKSTREVLAKGIDFGGDSMSDYRNPYGLPGEFQMHHSAYRRTGKECKRKGCNGIIIRKVIGGRSAHFCNVCQK